MMFCIFCPALLIRVLTHVAGLPEMKMGCIKYIICVLTCNFRSDPPAVPAERPNKPDAGSDPDQVIGNGQPNKPDVGNGPGQETGSVSTEIPSQQNEGRGRDKQIAYAPDENSKW